MAQAVAARSLDAGSGGHGVQSRRRHALGDPAGRAGRNIGYKATLCFHCAMVSLNLEALGEGVRVDVPLELLRRLRDSQVCDGAGRFMLADGRVEE